jgi:hypothetical protein
MKAKIFLLLATVALSFQIFVAPAQAQDWLSIQNEYFIVKYHSGYEADANVTLNTAMIVRNITLEKYPHALSSKVVIEIYANPQELGYPTAVAVVDAHNATIKILRPSWEGSWGGYEQLDDPFRRVLNHEYVHVPFYIDLYSKPIGYDNPPSWFSQGIAEYISQNYLPIYEYRVREAVKNNKFTIEEPYSWGLYILEFMYHEYEQEKIVNLIKSNASTFDDALTRELNETTPEFENKWKTYLMEKFQVSPTPSATPIIPEAPPFVAVAILATLTCIIALMRANRKYRKFFPAQLNGFSADGDSPNVLSNRFKCRI